MKPMKISKVIANDMLHTNPDVSWIDISRALRRALRRTGDIGDIDRAIFGWFEKPQEDWEYALLEKIQSGSTDEERLSALQIFYNDLVIHHGMRNL